MKDNLSNLEEIENWLNENLSANEKADFETKLKKDSNLKKEVEEVKALQLGIVHANQKIIRDQLKGVESELKSENFFEKDSSTQGKVVPIGQSTSKKSSRSWIGIAASLLFLIGIGGYLFTSNNAITNNNYDSQIAFENYYKPDTKEVVNFLDRLEARGVSDPARETKTELATALSLYNEAKYEEAIFKLNTFLDKNPNDNIANLYTGLTLLELSNNKNSKVNISQNKIVQHLQKAASDNSFQKANMAKWYLALSYIKADTPVSKTDAKKLLQELSNTSYKQQATQLLKTIK